MRSFKWIDWNRAKIAAHTLGEVEAEASFERVLLFEERNDGSYRTFAEIPDGRRIWVIWRYDRDGTEILDVFGELPEAPIFVITAY